MMTTKRRMRRRTLPERPLPPSPSSHVPLTVMCASSDQDAPPSVALADHRSRCLQRRRRAMTAPLPLTWCFVSFVTKDVTPCFFAFSFAVFVYFFFHLFPLQWCDETRATPDRLDEGHGGISDVFTSHMGLFSTDSCKHFVHKSGRDTNHIGTGGWGGFKIKAFK